MARPLSAIVTRTEMDALAESIELRAKIRRGELTEVPILTARRPAKLFEGVSDILRLRNQLGFQVATVHRLIDLAGDVRHWHCKDIRLGDILIRYQD